MPGGEGAIIVPDDPDRTAQIEIIRDHILTWFDAELSEAGEQDIEDCSAEIADDLNVRRLDLRGYFSEPDDIPAFVARHVVERSTKKPT